MKKVAVSLLNLVILAGVVVPLIGTYGCARVEVVRVKSEESYKEGIRFYRPAPYLLITRPAATEKEKTLQLSVIYLPDTSQEYAIRITPGLGTVTANVTLDQGWNLVGINRTIDTKLPETITAIGNAISGLPILKALGKKLGEELDPGLYRIDFDDKGYIKDLKPVLFSKQ